MGVVLGVAIGRLVWNRFTHQLGVGTGVAVPTLAILAISVVIIAVAAAIAVVPGWRAARLRPAVLLRTE